MDHTKSNNKIYLYTATAGLVGLGALYVMTKPQKVAKEILPPSGPSTLSVYEKGKHWACEPDAEIKISVAKEGIASRPPITVMHQFQKAVKNQGSTNALMVEREGKWISWTWQQYYDDVMCAARALIRLGFKAFDTINIIGFNAPEWHISNMAAIACGGKAAGIYTTNNPEACKYITNHSEAPVVVVENDQQLAKYIAIRDSCPNLKAIVMYSGSVPQNANVEGKAKVISWNEFMTLGKDDGKEAEELKNRIEKQQPGHCCTLIYTSGTTGNPKAVMISHDNATWTAIASGEILLSTNPEGEHSVSYLPLSHIAAQMLDIHQPICFTAERNHPFTVWFARPDALKGSLAATLKHVQPTLFFGVPRVWEKMEEAMKVIAGKSEGLKKAIASWAKGLGLEGFKNQQLGASGYLPAFHRVAKKLVFSKVREALGLQRCRMMYTGAAPIAHSTLNFFGSLDLPVLELFGMSECTGPHTICRPGYFKVGSTGPNMPGVETKIDHDKRRDKENEGEICMRGRNVMMGYMKDPDKTREAIDDEGYLHSGDVGRVDEYGCLYITGRIKELLITAGGENVAPVPVEDTVKKELPGISNAMMIGDKRKYNNILITLRTAPDEKTGGFTDHLAGASLKVDESCKTVEEAMKSAKWKSYIEDGLKRANKQAVSNAQTVQKFAILPMDFSVPGGELTPTLKLKRGVVSEKYKDIIEALYKE